jgi:cytochrome c553
VLIKQMADIRAGLRDNPTMYPFAKELTDAQELANVSAYIESLCIPVDHGKYEGPDAAKQVADGKAMYEKECVECHKANGEGEKDKFYPVLAGQHYKYLLRQMTEIRDGKSPQRQPRHGDDHQEIRQRSTGSHFGLPIEPRQCPAPCARPALPNLPPRPQPKSKARLTACHARPDQTKSD